MKIRTLPFILFLICFSLAQAQIVNKQSSKQELLQYHLTQLDKSQYEPHQLIVKFNKNIVALANGKVTSSGAVNTVLTEIMVESMKPVFEKNRDRNVTAKAQFGLESFFILHLPQERALADAMVKLNTLPEIEIIEPNYLASGTTVPNDTYYSQQWALNNTGQAVQYSTSDPVGTPGADLNLEAAWEITTGSSDVVVCILDSGVDTDHPEFVGRIVPGYDFQFNDTDPNPIPGETSGAHGTNCAGIVGASGNNGIGVAGISWQTKIMPIKALYDNSGTWTIISNGVIWAADNGADIISMSIGGSSYSSTLENAVNYAYNQGCTLFASSGNSNNDIGISPSYPAAFENTICVGALSPCEERKNLSSCDGEYWWGSNYGSAMDFLAPGTRNYSTDIAGSDGYDPGDYYPYFNGTSSACPHAAGIGALMLAVNPSLTNAQIRTIMQNSCVDMGDAGKDDNSGYGRIDALLSVQNSTVTYTEYCNADLYLTGCSLGDHFSYVALANLENANSGCSDLAYGDFSDQVVDVIQGHTYTLTVELGFSSQYVTGWIDFNDNVEFEPGETFVENFLVSNANERNDVSIHIDEDMPPGEHRLRLRSIWNDSIIDPCGQYSFGEVEDYTIHVYPKDQYGRIEGIVFDSETYQTIPGAEVQLGSEGKIETANENGYFCITVMEGLYDVSFSAPGYAAISWSDFSMQANVVHTSDIFLEHATCSGNLFSTACIEGDGIDNFFLSQIHHPASGCSENGYGDFTDMAAILACGQSYPLEVSSNYELQYLNLWIDFNDNYIFESDELLVDNGFLEISGTPYYFDVTLPETCALGTHILRARANFDEPFSDPCALVNYGEVHEYTVHIFNPENLGTVEGTVFNWDNDLPQAGVMIDIPGLGISTSSNPDGHYSFGLIPGGTHELSVNQSGYFDLSSSGDIMPDETTTHDFHIKPVHNNNFDFPIGWSGVSSVFYIDEDVNTMIGSFESDFSIISSLDGFYYPGQNVNTLGGWEDSPGYKIKTNAAFTFGYPGWMRKPSELTLPSGWGILPAWSDCSVSIEDVFAESGTQPIIVKEIAGTKVYWPEKSIFTLDQLHPGKAYLVLMENESIANFPSCEFKSGDELAQASEVVNNTNWEKPMPTGSSHMFHIPAQLIKDAGLNAGDYLGAFDAGGMCFGMVPVTGIKDHALAAFGDDVLTGLKDGFVEGEEIYLKAFVSKTNKTSDLEVTFDMMMPDQRFFATEGLSSVSLKSTGFSSAFNKQKNLYEIFPNPTSGIVNVKINEGSEILHLSVVDSRGRLFFEKKNLEHSTQDQRSFDLRAFPSGIYALKIITSSAAFEEKLIIR